MKRSQSKLLPEELVSTVDFPHLRTGGKWLTTNPSALNRLYHYAKELQTLGMSDINIQCMFSDLYWDASKEIEANAKPVRRKK